MPKVKDEKIKTTNQLIKFIIPKNRRKVDIPREINTKINNVHVTKI